MELVNEEHDKIVDSIDRHYNYSNSNNNNDTIISNIYTRICYLDISILI